MQEIGADLGLPIHLWPDTDLLDSFDPESAEYQWLATWLFRESPEAFAGRDPDPGRMPAPPVLPASRQGTLAQFGDGRSVPVGGEDP